MTKKISMRQCLGCRQMFPKQEMLRVIHTPEGRFCLDRTGRQNGRGAYMCFNQACMEQAKKTRALDRSFKMAVPADIYDSLSKELENLEA